MNANFRTCLTLSLISGAAVIAHAGSINASYVGPYGFNPATFTTNLPGHVGARSDNAGQMDGTRIDSPGPGVDNLVPFQFPAYCVEIGENVSIPGNNFHPDVVPLLGSVTTGGGISGPMTFDPIRTANMQKLWGSFFPLVSNSAQSVAFQLASWEIAFDNDLTLASATGSVWVTGGQFQAGITDLAESWLTDIRNGVATTQTPLVLLRGQGVQDLVTPANPVPEPASMAALALGTLALARRRRKSA
ncbi:MAG TPA: PEP-CTERM sorting domain-containing protein [Fimbriimonadaceae bacterium]|nr:PEP-CTERM sorting domain-containing protein [Fimbriimonadaceae bacterium]HRJ33767.1 PEP-CTERM sorting domain-containing protein [Fimbriimonadaceae bacterium]